MINLHQEKYKFLLKIPIFMGILLVELNNQDFPTQINPLLLKVVSTMQELSYT